MYKSIYNRNVHSKLEINKVKEVWNYLRVIAANAKVRKQRYAKVTLRGRYIYVCAHIITTLYNDMTSLITGFTLPSAKWNENSEKHKRISVFASL